MVPQKEKLKPLLQRDPEKTCLQAKPKDPPSSKPAGPLLMILPRIKDCTAKPGKEHRTLD